MGLEYQKPVRLHGESDDEYLMRCGESALQNMKAITARIDKMPLLAEPTRNSIARDPKTALERQRANRLSLADFLADKPHLRAAHRAGKYDPFEI